MLALGAIKVHGIGSVDYDLKHHAGWTVRGRDIAAVEGIVRGRTRSVSRALNDRVILYGTISHDCRLLELVRARRGPMERGRSEIRVERKGNIECKVVEARDQGVKAP